MTHAGYKEKGTAAGPTSTQHPSKQYCLPTATGTRSLIARNKADRPAAEFPTEAGFWGGTAVHVTT